MFCSSRYSQIYWRNLSDSCFVGFKSIIGFNCSLLWTENKCWKQVSTARHTTGKVSKTITTKVIMPESNMVRNNCFTVLLFIVFYTICLKQLTMSNNDWVNNWPQSVTCLPTGLSQMKKNQSFMSHKLQLVPTSPSRKSR